MVESGEWKHAVQSYLAANSFVDEMVGMLLDSVQNEVTLQITQSLFCGAIMAFTLVKNFVGPNERFGKKLPVSH